MSTQAQPQAACQSLQTPLAARPLLAPEHAAELRDLFKVLANDSRLRLLHALQREGELCVGELAERVGMSPQAVSNQLGRLADRRILAARRAGNRIYYRIVDPCVPGLLDLGICLLEETAPRGAANAPLAEESQ